MRPRHLPDRSLVSRELRGLLALIAIDDVENLDPPVGPSTRELLAIVVELDIVLRAREHTRAFSVQGEQKISGQGGETAGGC